MLIVLANLKEINSYYKGLGFFSQGGFIGDDEAQKRTENVGMDIGEALLRD